MDPIRRTLLGAGTALLLPGETWASAPSLDDPFPALRSDPAPGRAGDFDFLTGEWAIRHWRLRGPGDWDAFEGAATVHRILDGIGSVEELRIPARGFSGMGLRLLDVERRAWSDHWVNARSGVLATPGQGGNFEGGVGLFVTEATEDGQPVLYAGVWDAITPDSCRWRQGVSRDRGQSWAANWVMHWSRVTPAG